MRARVTLTGDARLEFLRNALALSARGPVLLSLACIDCITLWVARTARALVGRYTRRRGGPARALAARDATRGRGDRPNFEPRGANKVSARGDRCIASQRVRRDILVLGLARANRLSTYAIITSQIRRAYPIQLVVRSFASLT